MDWLKESPVDLTVLDKEINEFRIQRIENTEEMEKSYSILTEFYISLAATSPISLTNIFLKDSTVPKELLEFVIPHFNDVKIVIENNEPVEIMLKDPKQNSISFIQSSKRNKIIEDLFCSKTERFSREWVPCKTYKVEKNKIESYENEEFNKLLPYLSPPPNQSFLILPVYDWIMDDSLKESSAIRYFSSKFKEVYLWVDENKNVRNIQLVEH